MVRNLSLEEKIKKITKRGRQDFFSKWSKFLLYEEEENEENYEDVQYIDLVYPPGSNPPIRDSIKKISLISFKQISLE